jgi:hypothetical protein
VFKGQEGVADLYSLPLARSLARSLALALVLALALALILSFSLSLPPSVFSLALTVNGAVRRAVGLKNGARREI